MPDNSHSPNNRPQAQRTRAFPSSSTNSSTIPTAPRLPNGNATARNTPSRNSESNKNKQEVEEISRRICALCRHKETSIVERHTPSLDWLTACPDADKPELRRYTQTLLDLAVRSPSPSIQVKAMEEIFRLTIEDPFIRKTFKTLEQIHRLRDNTKNVKSDVAEWTSRVLVAIENERIHNLWSPTISGSLSSRDLQLLSKAGGAGNDSGGPSRLAGLEKSLRDPKSASLAVRYLKIAGQLSDREPLKKTTEDIAHLANNIRRLVVEARTSTLSEQTAGAKVDNSALRESCRKLVKHSSSIYSSVRIAALKEVISLTIEGPHIRKTLDFCQKDCNLTEIATTTSKPRIAEWASNAIFAIRNERIHDLWSKHISRRDLQLLSDERSLQRIANKIIVGDSEVLVELARSLTYSKASFLAKAYLSYAMKQPSTVTQVVAPKAPSRPSKPKTEEELLDYVISTAPKDAFLDLSEVIQLDTLEKHDGEGGCSEVFKRTVNISGKDVVVAIKRLKLGYKVTKNFAKELRASSRLGSENPHVLKPLGYMSRDSQYYIVSKWMEKGSLREFMPKLSMRERFTMSLGIAKGICYLHSNNFIHGDLKADNVLVSDSRTPLLADFGLSRIKESCWSKGYYSTETVRSSTRWMAYESYHHDKSEVFRPTQKTDVWAFGMTLLELLTGTFPYAELQEGLATARIVMGILPKKPTIDDSDADADLKHFIWSLCLKCWNLDPEKRPSMHEILKEISTYQGDPKRIRSNL